jgi:hypothetical protein
MTDNQRKILTKACVMLVRCARDGERLVRSGASAQHILAQATLLREMATEMENALHEHIGATVVLGKAVVNHERVH